MPRISLSDLGKGQEAKNIAAALDMLAFSEIGSLTLSASDDGYNVIVGSVPASVKTFNDYKEHPNVRVWLPKIKDWSTAAGRYQCLHMFAVAYMSQLRLPDFGPVSQDRIALQMFRECNATMLFANGHFDSAVNAIRSRWASLPGANYGQHENAIAPLRAAFQRAGGILA